MRAVVTTLWSTWLITFAVLSSVLCVDDEVEEKIDRYNGNLEMTLNFPARYMENGRFPSFPSKLQKILSTSQTTFPASFPHARVVPIERSQVRLHERDVIEVARLVGLKPGFILLGKPFPGSTIQGFSAAYPVEWNYHEDGRHLFAFISVHEGQGHPKVTFHGFAIVDRVPDLKTTIAYSSFPGVKHLEPGSILSANELFRNFREGLRPV